MEKDKFIPKEFREHPVSPGFYGIARSIYKCAKEMLESAEKDKKSFYILPSIILFETSLECYFNEILTVNLLLKKYSSKDVLLLLRSGNQMNFSKKIVLIFKVYDKNQKGLNTNSLIYRDLVALIKLRNHIVHYNPDWENIYNYPKDLHHIIKRVPITLQNGGWIANIDVPTGYWSKNTVKNTIVEFSNITGANNPFTEKAGEKLIGWDD